MTTPTYQVVAPIPMPDLTCAKIYAAPGGLCITFPGGAQLCAQAGTRFGDVSAMSESLFAALNAALLPLLPFFNIVDVFVAILNCITAIPKTIGPPPDPTALPKCRCPVAAPGGRSGGPIGADGEPDPHR